MTKNTRRRIKSWRKLRARQQSAQKELRQVDGEIEELEKDHLVVRPLLRVESDAIREHLLAGGNICCDDGREALERIVDDPIWVDRLSVWAYEHLGCSGMDRKWPKTSVFKFWRRWLSTPKLHLDRVGGNWSIACGCGWKKVDRRSDPDDYDGDHRVMAAFVNHCIEHHGSHPPGPNFT